MMPADPRTPLTESARRRHQETSDRARQALRDFEATGQPITYAKIARVAAVSRSWLYTQPDVRAAIDRLRDLNGRSNNNTPIPARQRSSDSSLTRRLEAAHHRNQELSREVTRLREQLAVAHADLRAAGRRTPARAAVDLTTHRQRG
jgi:hypothetical protein